MSPAEAMALQQHVTIKNRRSDQADECISWGETSHFNGKGNR